MSFFDRVGDFFNKVADATGTRTGNQTPIISGQAAWSAIGAAWSAGSDPDTGPAKFLSGIVDPIANGKYSPANWAADAGSAAVSGIGEALNAAYSYSVARPISTAAQVDYAGSASNYLNWDSWQQAWNRSEDISPGQALTLTAYNDFAGKKPLGADPFAPEQSKARQDFFQNSWGGKLASGTTDAILGFAVDPGTYAVKGIKGVEASQALVKAENRSKVLQAAVDPSKAGALSQGRSAAKLVDKIDRTPVHTIPSLPELANSTDAGALAVLFERAKKLNPKDPKARRQAIADILGTAWGDEVSKQRLIDQQTELATAMANLSNVPGPSKANDLTTWGADGQGVLELFDKRSLKTVDANKEKIQRQIDSLNRVTGSAGTSEARVIGTFTDASASQKTFNNINQSFIHSPGASPMRIVAQQTARRTPGAVDVKDASAGYRDISDVLGQMSHTSVDAKQKIMKSFVSAANSTERGNVVDSLRRHMVRDAAAKYGYSQDTAEELIRQGENRFKELQSTLKTRLYSAANGDGRSFISLHDPEDDITDVYHIPFMQSQLEDKVHVLNPHEVDRVFKAHANMRFVDKIGIPKQGQAVLDETGLLADQAAKSFTSLWKTAALARGAYPMRIQTDSQLRLMAHMETMQYMSHIKARIGGRVHYLMDKKEHADTDLNEMFRGHERYAGILRGTLSKKTIDPVFDNTEDDFAPIVRDILAHDGALADMGDAISEKATRKMRTGNFGRTDPEDPNWIDDYLRAVNQQVANSPTAVGMLETQGNIPQMAAYIRASIRAGQAPPVVKEYRKVGVHFDSMEDWLQQIVANNDHLLPHGELRKAIMLRQQGKNVGKAGHLSKDMVHRIFSTTDPDKVYPMPVHGEGFAVEQTGAIQARYRKVQQGFFRFAAEMPETVMARAPLFMDSYRRNISDIMERVGDEELTPERIDTIRKAAMGHARKEMGRILYNAADASNLSKSMRFLSPFFTAWEDTMTKWGKLIYDNPQIATRANHVHVNNSGLVVDDNGNRVDSKGRVFDSEGKLVTDKSYEGGQQYILLPKMLTSHIPGLGGGQVKIRKDSINSVFQGDPWWLPGFGPMVQVPTNHIVRESFPKEADDPIMKYVLPYGTTTDSAEVQLLPKWLKTAQNAFGTSQQFANQQAIFLAEASVDYQHGGPKPDLDKIKNKTRNYFILKAAIDNVSPVSIQPDAKYQLYIDKAHEYRSDPKRADWQADFYKDFPGYFDLSLSLSANNTGIVATNAAFDAAKKYRKDIQENPELGWMFVGPANTGNFSGGVYDWQQTNEAGKGLNFRGKKDPQVALEQAQAEKGWIQWNSFKTALNLELKQRGLHSTRQKGAEDLQAAQQIVEEQLSTEIPAWARARENSGGGDKPQAFIDAANAFMKKHPETQDRPDMVALQKYIAIREAVQQELANRPNKSLAYNDDLQEVMDAVSADLVENNVGFEAMYNRVLEYDKNISGGQLGN